MNFLRLAQEEAELFNSAIVRSEHLLLAIMRTELSFCGKAFRTLGIDEDIVRKLAKTLKNEEDGQTIEPEGDGVFLNQVTLRILRTARMYALDYGPPTITAEHLLMSMLDQEKCFAIQILSEVGIEGGRLKAALLERLNSKKESLRKHMKPHMKCSALREELHLMRSWKEEAKMKGRPDVSTFAEALIQEIEVQIDALMKPRQESA